MNPSSLDLAYMLIAELDFIFAINIFVGKEPPLPNNCVTIFDTPGRPPGVVLNGNVGYYYPACQVRVRNSKYIDGWTLIKQVQTVLHGRVNEVWNSMKYMSVVCVQEPFLLDWDEKDRARFVSTFNIERSPI